MDPAARAIDELPGAIGGVLRAALEADEIVTHVVPAIGCTLVLTARRLLIVRDGSSFRPRTGVRHWDVGPGLAVRPGLVRQGIGSLVIRWDRDITSVFVRADRWDDALALIGAVRGRVRVARTRPGG
ncbi:MAG TPA: hypothetical protein VFO73_10785 [Candidatus Limnocylindrales bacterium]|nr:hypothetical protein [Candidatus Limnocylindrales bacterium]